MGVVSLLYHVDGSWELKLGHNSQKEASLSIKLFSWPKNFLSLDDFPGCGHTIQHSGDPWQP